MKNGPILLRECEQCHTNIILEVEKNNNELDLVYRCNCGHNYHKPLDISDEREYELKNLFEKTISKLKAIEKKIIKWDSFNLFINDELVKVNTDLLYIENTTNNIISFSDRTISLFSDPYFTLDKSRIKFAIKTDDKNGVFISYNKKFRVFLNKDLIQIFTDNTNIEFKRIYFK